MKAFGKGVRGKLFSKSFSPLIYYAKKSSEVPRDVDFSSGEDWSARGSGVYLHT